MSKEIWTVIKYKPKDGGEEEFVESLKDLANDLKVKSWWEVSKCLIKINNGEYVQIVQMPHLESFSNLTNRRAD